MTAKFKNRVDVGALRSFQRTVYAQVRGGYLTHKEDKTLVAVVAAGGGKTWMAMLVARALLERGDIERILYLAPRTSLIAQTMQAADLYLDPYYCKRVDQIGRAHV